MTSCRSVVFALVALLCLAEPLALVASAAPRLRPYRPQARDAAPIVRGPGAGELGAALDRLTTERRLGQPFAIQEVEILDAWNEGLEIATIEAEVLASRAIYERYVARTLKARNEPDALVRWRAYALEHAVELQARNVKLNEGLNQRVLPPDNSDDWRLYSDPELYNELSSAFQRRLEAKFGRRGKVTVPGDAGTAESVAGGLPNTLVNNPAADTNPRNTQSETTLVLGAGNNILVSFNDSGLSSGGQHFTGIARSTNSGTTFTDQAALPVTAAGDAGDPVYARNNTTGSIILSTLDFGSGATLPIFRTTDNGATYGGAPPNGAAGGGSHDKEWVTADNFAGAGNGNFYMFWRDFGGGGGMTITRSTNDGVTWGSRQNLDAGAGQGAWVVVGADHTVYTFWLKSAPNRIVMRKSTDQGLTFNTVSTVQTLTVGGVNGDLGLTGGFRSNSFPQVVCDPTNSQRLYMAFNDTGTTAGDKADTYFTYSTNGGTTWAPRTRVNSDSTATDQWQPVIAMASDGSGVFVSWYDRRGNGTAIDVYGTDGTICADGSVAFVPEYRISDTAFPVIVGVDPAIVSTYMGDYDQAVATSTNYYRTWGDNRSGSPDVRFTIVPKSAPVANLRATGATLGAENCTPDNNAIDPGETVTVTLGLKNFGGLATSSLVGTLQATGGVTAPSAPQNFGAIASCGGAQTASFTFTAMGACGGTITASLQLQDGPTNLGTVTYTFFIGVPGTQVFANPAAITINDNAAGSPYPSTVTVSGVTSYTRVTLSLNGLSHTFPDDIDIIVVAPGGQKAYVMSDNGSGTDISGVNLVFDDTAAAALTTATISSGTFKPSNLDTTTDAMPAPAPAPPYLTDFTSFNALGGAVNGTWSLYVRDDVGTDTGSISGGWSINFVNPPTCSTSCGAPNMAPTANAGMDQSVNECTPVMLNGGGSSDPDGGPSPLTYAWAQTAGPTVVINNPTSSTPTFEAPAVPSNTVLTFQLTVSDGAAMAMDTINVTSNPVAGVHVDTVGLHTTGGNTFFLRNCNGPGPADITTTFGANGTIPLRGDWDNNGTETAGAYDPVSGCFFFRNANTPGPADIIACFGPPGATPLVGDWDGNGSVTVGVYDSGSGTFFIKNSNSPGPADITVSFGPAGATPLVGDWDGNGSQTIGIYIPAGGAWFLKNSIAGGDADITFSYGAAGIGLVPVVGNWDGISGDTIGVFDPTTGAFFLRNANSTGGADIVFQFGVGGMVRPLGGNWDGF
jgi:subtilisin-like proprotein convertase family protein